MTVTIWTYKVKGESWKLDFAAIKNAIPVELLQLAHVCRRIRKRWYQQQSFLRRIHLNLHERRLGSILRYNITAPDLFEVIQFLMIFSHYSVHVVPTGYSVTTAVSYLLASEDRVGPRKSCSSGLSEHLSRSTIVVNPYPTAFPYGNGTVLHFYQQQESSTTKTVHKVINKRLKTYV